MECVYQSDWKSYEKAVPAIEAREQNALGGLAPLEFRAELLRKLVA